MRLLLARRGEHVKGPLTNLRVPVARPTWPELKGIAFALRVVGMLMPFAVGFSNASCRLEPAPVERATLLAERGQEPQAIRLLEEHLQRAPEDVPARRQLIRLYGSVGRLDQANAQTERLADMLPRASPVPSVELGHALELAHHFDEALAAYDRATQIAPQDALGPRTGGERAAHWGQLEVAEPRLEEAVRRDAKDASSWHLLGVVRLGLGKLELARQAYATGLQVDPSALENRLGLATVALRTNRPDIALAQYDALLEARPQFTGALLGKSWSLILLGQWDAAEAALARAAALGADPKTLERQRGAIRDRRGRSP